MMRAATALRVRRLRLLRCASTRNASSSVMRGLQRRRLLRALRVRRHLAAAVRLLNNERFVVGDAGTAATSFAARASMSLHLRLRRAQRGRPAVQSIDIPDKVHGHLGRTGGVPCRGSRGPACPMFEAIFCVTSLLAATSRRLRQPTACRGRRRMPSSPKRGSSVRQPLSSTRAAHRSTRHRR